MKSILRILADIALLPVSGCILPPNRDNRDNWDDSTRAHVSAGVARGDDSRPDHSHGLKPDTEKIAIYGGS